MSEQTLESRVERLELQMSQLCGAGPLSLEPGDDDWEETVGVFRGDPVFQGMIELTERTRDEERRLAREQARSQSQ